MTEYYKKTKNLVENFHDENLSEDAKELKSIVVEARKLGITIATQREAIKMMKAGTVGFIQNLQDDADRITQYVLEGSLLNEDEIKESNK